MPPFTLLSMAMEVLSRDRTSRFTGLAAVAGAALLWAASAAVASNLFESGVTPLELVQARAYLTVAGLALLPAARRAWSPASWQLVVALGLAIALVNLTYYVAIDRIPVAVAIVLQYSGPAMIVIWTSALRRRMPPPHIVLAVLAAIAGVVLVSELLTGRIGHLDSLGIVMGLGAAVMFATYTVLSEKAQDRFGPVGAIFRGFVVASVFWLLVQLPQGIPHSLFVSENVLQVLFVGLGGTLLPFLLYVWGVGRMRAERASIAATLEPVFAAVIAWIWLNQSLSPMQVGGGLLVIGAVILLQLRRDVPPVPVEF